MNAEPETAFWFAQIAYDVDEWSVVSKLGWSLYCRRCHRVGRWSPQPYATATCGLCGAEHAVEVPVSPGSAA